LTGRSQRPDRRWARRYFDHVELVVDRCIANDLCAVTNRHAATTVVEAASEIQNTRQRAAALGRHLQYRAVLWNRTAGLDGGIRLTDDCHHLHVGIRFVPHFATSRTCDGTSAAGGREGPRWRGDWLVLRGSHRRAAASIPARYACSTGLATLGNFPGLVACGCLLLLSDTQRHPRWSRCRRTTRTSPAGTRTPAHHLDTSREALESRLVHPVFGLFLRKSFEHELVNQL